MLKGRCSEEFLRKSTKFLQDRMLIANDLYFEICFLQRDYYLLITERLKRLMLVDKMKELMDQMERVFQFRGVNKDVFIYVTFKKIIGLIYDIFEFYGREAQTKSNTVHIHRIKIMKRRLESLHTELEIFNTNIQGNELLQELKQLVA